MGIVIGGVVTLVALVLFLVATFKAWDEKRKWRNQQLGRPDPKIAPPKGTTSKKVLHGIQIAGVVFTLAGVVVAIYFGVKPRVPS